MTLHWSQPALLLLLVPLALFLIWLWVARREALPHPRSGALLRAGVADATIRSRLPLGGRALAMLLLVLAIAGPRTAGAGVEEEELGVPIVVAIDVSSSMLARDFAGADRLSVAKAATRRFIADRPRDPIGIVAFAGEALTLVPITRHQRVLAAALDQLSIGLLEDGTAIGDGLATALNRLRRIEAESRVVILMSDGENNRGTVDPLESAAAAAALGVRVFTIGVGSDAPATREIVAEMQVDEAAAGLDEALLREIAAVTGGGYFRATGAEVLHEVYSEIDRLVTSPIETRRHVRFREWHLPLLLLAAGVLVGEWALRGSRLGVVP